MGAMRVRAAAPIVSVLTLLLGVVGVAADATGGEGMDHREAQAGGWGVFDRDGPLGDWGPGHPAWAEVYQVSSSAASDSEAMHDAGIALLQAATDQTWGIYSLAARSLVASLRLAEAGVTRPSALYHLGFAIQSLREHAGAAWRAQAQSAFTLATQASPGEGSFEGLAWFYVSNGDGAGAVRAYSAGLDALCEPPGACHPSSSSRLSLSPILSLSPSLSLSLVLSLSLSRARRLSRSLSLSLPLSLALALSQSGSFVLGFRELPPQTDTGTCPQEGLASLQASNL